MNKQPITVIVVLYYSNHLIAPLLANVTEKITELGEIILVDNSNQDLTEFESELVRVFHTHQNIGYGAAINLGVSMAKNDNIVAMNPDVFIEKFDIAEADFPIGKVLWSGKPIEWETIRCFPTLTFDFLRLGLFNLARAFKWIGMLSAKKKLGEKPTKVDWVSGALILTNKETMTHIGGFDEKYFLFYEELDLCKRAELMIIPRFITPAIQFRLNQGTSSATDVSKIKTFAEMNSAKRYHCKYSGRILTWCMFFTLKLHCHCVGLSLGIVTFLFKNPKIQKKQLQYKAYADAI